MAEAQSLDVISIGDVSVDLLMHVPHHPNLDPDGDRGAPVDIYCGVAPGSHNGSYYAAVSVYGRKLEGEVPPINAALVRRGRTGEGACLDVPAEPFCASGFGPTRGPTRPVAKKL